jgi:hypothetical protein
MHFEDLLRTWKAFFEDTRIRYALTGHLALHAYGYRPALPRIDIAVEKSGRAPTLKHAQSLGFHTVYTSPTCAIVSNDAEEFSRIAFVFTPAIHAWTIPFGGVLLPVRDPGTPLALSERDVAALREATVRLSDAAYRDWLTLLSETGPPRRHNTDADEPFEL